MRGHLLAIVVLHPLSRSIQLINNSTKATHLNAEGEKRVLRRVEYHLRQVEGHLQLSVSSKVD